MKVEHSNAVLHQVFSGKEVGKHYNLLDSIMCMHVLVYVCVYVRVCVYEHVLFFIPPPPNIGGYI